MSMQITVDPTKLSQEQREAVAGFILAFPDTHSERLGVKIEVDTKDAITEINKLKDAAQNAAHAVEEISPEAAFGKNGLEVGSIDASTIIVIPNETSSAGSVPLDKDGFPWDARIHSSNKATVADGTWRKKRGVDAALVTQVEAELRQVMGAPTPPPAPAAANIPVATVPTPPPAAEMPPIPPALARAPTPPPAPAPVANADDRNAYVALVGRTSRAVADKRITQEQVAACCMQFGVTALPLLANRLDLVPHVAAAIDAFLVAK